MENCIFCKIIKGELPCYKVYEEEKVIVILDIHPWARGHCLVIPKKHFQNIFDVDEETLKVLILVVKKISVSIKEKLGAKGINVLLNNGEIAGQIIPHIHFQIIPRYKDDRLKMSHTQKYKGDDLEEVLKALTD